MCLHMEHAQFTRGARMYVPIFCSQLLLHHQASYPYVTGCNPFGSNSQSALASQMVSHKHTVQFAEHFRDDSAWCCNAQIFCTGGFMKFI